MEGSSRRRGSSASTVKAASSPQVTQAPGKSPALVRVRANLSIHDDISSPEELLVDETILAGSDIQDGDLVELSFPARTKQTPATTRNAHDGTSPPRSSWSRTNQSSGSIKSSLLFLIKFAAAEFKAKQGSRQLSLNSGIANSFELRNGMQVELTRADVQTRTASHVEFSFRDAYIPRSDMWRMIGNELTGRTVYSGQRITYLGGIRLVVKSIHTNGHKVISGYFSGHTMPIFRSEAARYVIFIQMSREMWDFDSEGNGEILFNRVINGFLPDLFRRWTDLEVRHLVSIVLFGRQEYSQFDLASRKETSDGMLPSSSASSLRNEHHQDFYKVVVADMASAQWTTILDELKKNFRIFLRDVSLHPPTTSTFSGSKKLSNLSEATRITGTPTSAMRGNILEAINIASSQFSNDYVDRDLIRTGISVVVITAGTGVFEVDRDLLNLTSENLTNNGIGIDIVCLSKMPLHSVPLFKYKLTPSSVGHRQHAAESLPSSPGAKQGSQQGINAAHSVSGSPVASSSHTGRSFRAYSGMSPSLTLDEVKEWCYGIPHWVDLSYWSPDAPKSLMHLAGTNSHQMASKVAFVPRVRMYEVQMMGLVEMGTADISIPFLSESLDQQHHQTRRRKSKLQAFTPAQSASYSPKLHRRTTKTASSSFQEQGLISTHAKRVGDMYQRMDKYDDALFSVSPRDATRPSSQASGQRHVKPLSQPLTTSGMRTKDGIEDSDGVRIPGSMTLTARPKSPAPLDIASIAPSTKPSTKALRAARTTSYALRGLAPPVRAVASTEVNVENAQAQMPRVASPVAPRPAMGATSDSFRSLATRGTNGESTLGSSLAGNDLSPVAAQAGGETPSTPIKINKIDTPTKGRGQVTQPLSQLAPKQRQAQGHSRQNASISDSSSNVDFSGSSASEGSDLDGTFESLPNSVPPSNVPFIRNVNASNPLKGNPHREAFFGRWQHLYPRKPRAATVKWRSLCTPASVPLTTEDFPSKSDLEASFDSSTYTIALENTREILENPESRDALFREMLSLRFAHGYQLVVGSRVNRFEGPGLSDPSFFFNPDAVRVDGQYVFLSMGNAVHKVSFVENNCISVTRYNRRKIEVQPAFVQSLDYYPNIQTILSGKYHERTMQLKGFSEEYPWEEADRYLAASKKKMDNKVQLLRFWRARFVLLPVEPPANAIRPTPQDSEENEEEIHLRGIRALTQMWQRARYIPPEDRRSTHNRSGTNKTKDHNPLSISLETLNPSELVATELDKLLAAEEAGDVQTTQLLPEEEQFDRESAPLTKLAAAIQGERGIEIKNRRWHLRLHYSCFRGEEFTNWIVQNFRDIDTREEAVDLGNDLMKEGLFEHVNSRHNFKDGNFFYSIKAEHRVARPELRASWFPTSRRSDRSIPATPASETAPNQLPIDPKAKSQPGPPATFTGQPITEAPKSMTEKKRLAVSLSKVIRLNVDIKGRSNRPEIVNLHYDRLHNPENCYHLELSWLNVTSKLVDDAIVSWTNQAGKYGLKLVEVPIAEANEVPLHEPFRAPYRVKLCKPPPERSPTNGNVYFTTTSFNPQQQASSYLHVYQKALLKHFNFVLDLEAVCEFPENVIINYSWGKLEYQYTQFVHRSGVILAQITDEGNILLLANRLYNSRLASTKVKEAVAKFDSKRENPLEGLRPPLPPTMQASGIVGVNVQSPTPTAISNPSPMLRPASAAILSPSPLVRATLTSAPTSSHQHPQDRISADVFGTRIHPAVTSNISHFITPEQIKDDLEYFCTDPVRLEAFYREVSQTMVTATPRQDAVGAGANANAKRGSTSSSLLRPVVEVTGVEGDELSLEGKTGGGIPEFRLPESLAGFRRKGTG